MSQSAPSGMSRRSVLRLLGATSLAASSTLAGAGTAHADASARAQNAPDLDARIQEIIGRPEFRNFRWGMAFSSTDEKAPIYAMNQDELFEPASARKVFIAATAVATLGPDYRFRTRVYRTGPVEDGVLRGGLVLVASGDLLLDNRVQPDGTVANPVPDGPTPDVFSAPGDPLQVIRDLAGQVAAQGIGRVEGRVLVDASLFREHEGRLANGGIPITISPMMINDNVVEVTVTPGSRVGAPAGLRIAPNTAYVRFANDVRTVAASEADEGSNMPGAGPLEFTDDVTNPDGTHHVRVTGALAVGGQAVVLAYYVREPVRFAEMALTEALRGKGVNAGTDLLATHDLQDLAAHYTDENQVAEHVSPPVSEQVKPMLKVSSNIHTTTWGSVIGAIAGGEQDDPRAVYDRFQDEVIGEAGLDPGSQGEAEDGRGSGYSPEFFVQFLTHMARKPDFSKYRDALPIMGVDGTLFDIQPDSPAAGHVFAKTGTAAFGSGEPGSSSMFAKALAGYVERPDGQLVAFAEFMGTEAAPSDAIQSLYDPAGQALGEIATAVYESR